MEAYNVPHGCNPPEYMNLSDVPQLCGQLVQESHKRQNGTHLAQPVLCRAGPGTGKTWMVKQCLFLLAEKLGSEQPGEGIRLVPCIVFVQRIVRLLNELGDDPSELLSDPNGLMRWYITNQFADKKEEKTMLIQAYEMSSLCILVDGVDEAAGLRELVEAFVHYELVTSGNRLVVTSRPEGVDLEDYKTRFVVMNLKELSQEQQRNVIQMQLQGNAFFEHLVNIAECRKDLDAKYKESFRSEALRNDIEAIEFNADESEAVKKGPRAARAAKRGQEGGDAEKRAAVEGNPRRGRQKKAEEEAAEKERQGGQKESGAARSPRPRRDRAARAGAPTARARQPPGPVTWLGNVNLKESRLVLPRRDQPEDDQADEGVHVAARPARPRDPHDPVAVHARPPEPAITCSRRARRSSTRGCARRGAARHAAQMPIQAAGGAPRLRRCPRTAVVAGDAADGRALADGALVPILMYVLGGLASAVGARDYALQIEQSTGRPMPNTAPPVPEPRYRDPCRSGSTRRARPRRRPPERRPRRGSRRPSTHARRPATACS